IIASMAGAALAFSASYRSHGFLRGAWALVGTSLLMGASFDLSTYLQQTQGGEILRFSIPDALLWFYVFPLALLIFIPDHEASNWTNPSNWLDYAQVAL